MAVQQGRRWPSCMSGPPSTESSIPNGQEGGNWDVAATTMAARGLGAVGRQRQRGGRPRQVHPAFGLVG